MLINLMKANGNKKSHLHCPVIAAGADELGPSSGRVAGVNEGGVALQTLDPLACFTVPHTYSLVCACRKQHAEIHRKKTQLVKSVLRSFINTLDQVSINKSLIFAIFMLTLIIHIHRFQICKCFDK